YNETAKNFDEDSRMYQNGKANRRWWKSGASKVYLNITSELQILNRQDKDVLVRTDGVPPLQGRHMIVCLGGL
ncbi:MAG: hypothetical protein ACI4D9_02565, partial [Lachnospiraceae bacterium]